MYKSRKESRNLEICPNKVYRVCTGRTLGPPASPPLTVLAADHHWALVKVKQTKFEPNYKHKYYTSIQKQKHYSSHKKYK